MATKPTVKAFQDVPPPGGYPEVPFKRDLRKRGPPGWVLFGITFAAMGYGLYRIGQANERRRLERAEAKDCRMAIYPYLQAEQDRWHHEEVQKQLKKDAEIMKDYPDWKGLDQVYSKRWNDPLKYINNYK